MIARNVILFLLLNILPFLYFYLRYFRHTDLWKQILCWLPSIAMVIYTIYLAMEPNFIPNNDRIYILYTYLMLLGLVIVPIWVFLLSSLIGRGCSALVRKYNVKRQSKPRRNYGNFVGVLLIPVIWFILLWGAFPGFNKFEVNHTEYVSPELPEAFDGYRIVVFSDAHVGSYQQRNTYVLQEAIDSINAQHPDMIIFAGDLLNIQPADLYPHKNTLSKLKATDGVFSVLGNHDYAEYLGCDDAIKAANCKETISLEKQLGWTLLNNESLILTRDKDHIVLAGMENDGDGKHFPQKGDIKKTLAQAADSDFILLIEHDPSSWRRKIVPDGRAQLTISGHTHAMQFNIFGWCPMSLMGKEFWGWYEEGRQKLFVSAGLGGLIPFRFGATGEIVVLTLKRN